MIRQIKNFLKLESSGGILLFAAAILAIICANTGVQSVYFDFLQTQVVLKVGAFAIDKPLLMWINDGFMAVFLGLKSNEKCLKARFQACVKLLFLHLPHLVE